MTSWKMFTRNSYIFEFLKMSFFVNKIISFVNAIVCEFGGLCDFTGPKLLRVRNYNGLKKFKYSFFKTHLLYCCS